MLKVRNKVRLNEFYIRAFSTSKRLCANVDGEITTPPKNAKVVVCGGGVMGASVSYHLAKLGWGSETVLIEQTR